MRILCCVCYFLTLFYGVELVFEDEPSESAPVNYVTIYENEKPFKESIEGTTVCAYYSTSKICTDVYSKQVTFFSIE